MPSQTQILKETQLKNGQYFTPALLCDLMLALSYRYQKIPQRCLEPACGDGIFLRRAWHHSTNQCQDALSQWTAVEQEPLAFESVSQWVNDLSVQATIRMLQADFLKLIPEKVGKFDLIIGNPPYIRQELLSQNTAKDKLNRSKEFQKYFSDYLGQFPEQKKLFSQKADLYQWFFLQAFRLLDTDGILTFVVSNSWLDTQFGKHLQHFLLHHFDWLILVESACERWFNEAAINPVIIVLRKKSENTTAPKCHLIRLQKPLKDWLPDIQSPTYWSALQAQIQALETHPDVQLRIQTLAELTRWHQNNHWNVALRAPNILQQLLQENRLWRQLDQLGTVRYPLKTGINEFFYLNPETISQWQLEPEFLVPAIRSSKTISQLKVKRSQLQTFAFYCPGTKEELLQQQKTGALQYIEWGEQQKTALRQKRFSATLWPNVPSVQGNHPWYHLKQLPPAHLLCNRFVDQRFFFALCEGEFVEDQTFYGMTLFNTTHHPPAFIAGLLNSTVSCALLEFLGRASLGEGVLQFARCDMTAFPILNPDLYSPSEQALIQEAFEALAQQTLHTWQQDWDSPFRIQLDQAVLTPILKHLPSPMDVNELRTELAQALLQRMLERRAMAKSSRKKKAPNPQH